MRAAVAFVLTSVFVAVACSSPAPAPMAGDVTVFAGSSLTDAFRKAGDEMTKANPDARFTFNFGSSSTLATQIINGAPADAFASADEANMLKIVDAELTDGAPTAFAGNRLEIAVAAGNPKRIATLADLARPDVVLVLAAPTVPAGKYALEALTKAGVSAKPVSQEVDVRAVLNKVSLGEADAGIVYVTDVKSAAGRVTGVDIPEQQQVLARYPIAVVKDSKNAALAHRFVDYLVSPAGQSVLAEFGFSKP
jgi:molybdate transport system substrate-binding protein